ncbi:hypothetical protein B0H13DRAFT_2574722 [Mycena leptocephala]|nr:hypothetical protein B0H13DRAFT_2574722 [Mycena leptocephala]
MEPTYQVHDLGVFPSRSARVWHHCIRIGASLCTPWRLSISITFLCCRTLLAREQLRTTAAVGLGGHLLHARGARATDVLQSGAVAARARHGRRFTTTRSGRELPNRAESFFRTLPPWHEGNGAWGSRSRLRSASSTSSGGLTNNRIRVLPPSYAETVFPRLNNHSTYHLFLLPLPPPSSSLIRSTHAFGRKMPHQRRDYTPRASCDVSGASIRSILDGARIAISASPLTLYPITMSCPAFHWLRPNSERFTCTKESR